MAIERGHMPYAIEAYNAMDQGGDYARVAQALGSWGKRVEKVDDFLPSLREAIEVTESGNPALLDCIVKEGYDFSKYP
jgi:thiamine pyrophosphate-dependent acetolactate synthase large subunit-like protein